MTAKQFNKILFTLNWTQGYTAEYLGVTIRTISNWANGHTKVPLCVQKLLELQLERS